MICAISDEETFRNVAKESIIKWWNSQKDLVDRYGVITHSDIFVVWQCKAIENFKALLGVYMDGDEHYFEFTYHAAKERCYLDIYKKETQVVVSV